MIGVALKLWSYKSITGIAADCTLRSTTHAPLHVLSSAAALQDAAANTGRQERDWVTTKRYLWMLESEFHIMFPHSERFSAILKTERPS